MLSQMPFPPSGNVNDAYFYVEAPWIKDLSKYNMNVDESMYMDIDKYNGKYVFSMGRVGAYNIKVVVVPLPIYYSIIKIYTKGSSRRKTRWVGTTSS